MTHWKECAGGHRIWVLWVFQFLLEKDTYITLQLAAESKTYCDESKGKVVEHGLKITELSTHLQGLLAAIHPAYNEMFDGFADSSAQKNRKARTEIKES